MFRVFLFDSVVACVFLFDSFVVCVFCLIPVLCVCFLFGSCLRVLCLIHVLRMFALSDSGWCVCFV